MRGRRLILLIDRVVCVERRVVTGTVINCRNRKEGLIGMREEW